MEKIKIAKPCTENWELMSPQEKGRFCSVCYKCVIILHKCRRRKSGR
ncbi:hypothetical protein [uncultured Chryseobacterium sp.]|nr:hypothetical protein [uncultured Chryseobacterium sp.]